MQQNATQVQQTEAYSIPEQHNATPVQQQTDINFIPEQHNTTPIAAYICLCLSLSGLLSQMLYYVCIAGLTKT